MIFNPAQCKAINYFIHELRQHDIQFLFVDPLNSEDRAKLYWQSGQSTTEAVYLIISEAQTRNATILIGAVNSSNWNGSDSFFVGYKENA